MTSTTLLLLQFNNYYNRQIKFYETYPEYLDAAKNYAWESNIDFKPGDGISTTVIINPDIEEEFDYVVVCKDGIQGPIPDTRWWVIDSERTSYGQYRLKLYRDVIADNYLDVIRATSFIEKATLSDLNDPAIYNKEDMTFNEIKVREDLIKDETQIPWIVGYVARPGTLIEKEDGSVDITEDRLIGDAYSTVPAAAQYNFSVNGIANWAHYNKTYTIKPKVNTILRVVRKFEPLYGDIEYMGHKWTFNQTACSWDTTDFEDSIAELDNGSGLFEGVYTFGPSSHGFVDFSKPFINILKDIDRQEYQEMIENFVGSQTVDGSTISGMNGKYIKDTLSNRVYRITVKTTSVDETYGFNKESEPYKYLINHINLDGVGYIGADNPYNSWEYTYTAEKMQVLLEEVLNEVSVTFTEEKTHLIDQPYDMFCIPAGDIVIKDKPLAIGYTAKGDLAIRLAQDIARKFSLAVYDVQLLPYCPCREVIDELNPNTIVIGGVKSLPIYEDIGDENIEVSRLIWCQTSKFSFTKYQTIDFEPNTVLDKKIASLTKKYRLSSPNYAAAFDFDPQKNNGVDALQIDCLYKPFSPYIHVCPVFKKTGLYGGDYNDARGLICAGEFSIARVNSAWEDYQLQNKNFEKTFQRQIENLEITQSTERTSQIVNAITGTVSGGVGGAIAGSNFGPWGAAIGGAIGTATALAGGIADYNISEALRDEAKSYQKDLYGYNLDNIKAMPTTLSKVSAFDPNHKIFPFVETYSCSDKEREALKNKLKYNGMTVGRIGSIIEFVQSEPSYVKAQLIRLDIPDADFHLVNTIAAELYKGVFI